MSPVLHWCVAGAAVSLVMTALYFVQRRTGNAGIVDVAWAACIGATVVLFAFVGRGPVERRAAVAAIAALWASRLSVYLFRRVRRDAEEDGRYANLRKEWGDNFQRNIFWFFQVQAVAVLLFSFAPWMAMQATRPSPDWLDAVGALLAAVGLSGAGLADWQLSRFRSQPSNKGHTCQDGLWRYSRHPNYFFEWLHWWGYVLISWGAPAWWLTAATPMILLYLLLYKTGIPPTEAQAIASRGDEYRRYQQTTSAFVPWFRREPSGSSATTTTGPNSR